MITRDDFQKIGLFDARVPRYTSYPPANHFNTQVGPSHMAQWLRAVPRGGHVSLYLHIPYCRRLCWFCACRTQGTATDRPLRPYLDQLLAELALVAAHLPADVRVSRVHLGGGTPTILPPDMLRELGAALRAFRPFTRTAQFSVEIDPTEVDAARLDALVEIGMTRASIGVQDFDPEVQQAIGRDQPFDLTRDVVAQLRARGVRSVNMDVLYGLPYQTRDSLTETMRKVLLIRPDRLAMYGYAHVPWVARRQVMIPEKALPDGEARLNLFETARRLMLWEGYREVGIDHFCLPEDGLALASEMGTLRRNFQGYTEENANALIALGASAISRFPQGYAQNVSASADYAAAISQGRLATARGHALSIDDLLRGGMIEELMCRFSIDVAGHARRFGMSVDEVTSLLVPLLSTCAAHLVVDGHQIELTGPARHLARIAAQTLDAYAAPGGRHSRAV
ncbi:oxygen-independent coproporphyrinogen III oxidase [Ketogulonicigenium robustum]|uniref:Coproporphyrinogen-III oxidase n=1 Tax=Ketogulonicigenium robustum TaxID=92947 RepID=A0A1W6NX75_9RHOB|nr:oxygen-independent coproporphyrinogen III oxidase [Ketogulonicigenium robustum]ARO13835.1 oxygen-independent coproporphyrinogen III oxidase [Ketogulonicigenium robustum]